MRPLNKTTIANLNNMDDIKGGTPGTVDTCLKLPGGGSYCLACYDPPDDPPNNTVDCQTAACYSENPNVSCVPCTFPTICDPC